MSVTWKFSKRCELVETSAVREILRVIGRKDVISFAGGLPDPATFPVSEVKEAVNKVIESDWASALQYASTEGIRTLREEIAKFMIRRETAQKVDPENVLITAGSQEALYIIAAALLDPGDYVIVERPTYLAMLQVLNMFQVNIVSITLQEDGIDIHELEYKLKKLKQEGKNVKFLYLVPTCQNPTGITTSNEKRKAILELAEKFDIYIVEDDPYSYYLYEPINVKTLKSLDTSGRVIYTSTFSKILAPGLRLGWVVANEEVIQQLCKIKQILNLQTCTFSQYIAAYLLKEHIIDRNLSRIIEHYRKKRDHMLNMLETYMPSGCSWTKPSGGMFIWVRVPEKLNMSKLLTEAIEKYGIAYVPGEAFYPENPEYNTMRLNFTYPTLSQIEEGVRRLATLIKDHL